ncbi:GTP-binding protein Era [Constrictibacter sp. MBR-5]|jgi:GTP-binding protein Era|uniref:GTPase Era n=1 Tax=Constrictibacter sp. MBR-5 TaxID=3156467 RepID=UPI0033910BA6
MTETEADRSAQTRCGYVAIIGAPNAGKSTLLNLLAGTKLSIVSPKVQTTRSRVLGIRIEGDAQVVFVDTPGIFQPRRRLDRAMVHAAWEGAGDADLVLLLIDAERGIDADADRILANLHDGGRKVVVALNKVDLVRRSNLLELAAKLNETGVVTDIFMISALTGDGVSDLLDHLAKRLPDGPWLFPEDQLSDVPMRQLAAEITREKLFLQLHQELPYAATVETETWEEFDNGDVRIGQVVFVQREGQRAIILGKGGRQIRAIGEAARTELQELLERKVHLFLHVKVREQWTEDPERYRAMGLDHKV